MTLGVFFGFMSAFSIAVSYLFSRRFVARFNNSSWHLLAISHVIMGVMSLAPLLFFLPKKLPPFIDYAFPVGLCTFAYMMAQGFLFLVLKKTDASRVSPLLGLKIAVIAIIGMLFYGKSFVPVQWLAIVLSMCAAFLLSRSGSRLGLAPVALIVLTCVGYSFSDFNVEIIMKQFAYLPLWRATVIGVCLIYIVCGVFGLVLLFFLDRPSVGMWKSALPFSVIWLVAMVFLFSCYALIGPVYGNIMQSSRGIISIILGSLVAAAGHVHLEEKIHKSVLVRRIAAAAFMTAAIVLFAWGS